MGGTVFSKVKVEGGNLDSLRIRATACTYNQKNPAYNSKLVKQMNNRIFHLFDKLQYRVPLRLLIH